MGNTKIVNKQKSKPTSGHLAAKCPIQLLDIKNQISNSTSGHLKNQKSKPTSGHLAVGRPTKNKFLNGPLDTSKIRALKLRKKHRRRRRHCSKQNAVDEKQKNNSLIASIESTKPLIFLGFHTHQQNLRFFRMSKLLTGQGLQAHS